MFESYKDYSNFEQDFVHLRQDYNLFITKQYLIISEGNLYSAISHLVLNLAFCYRVDSDICNIGEVISNLQNAARSYADTLPYINGMREYINNLHDEFERAVTQLNGNIGGLQNSYESLESLYKIREN